MAQSPTPVAERPERERDRDQCNLAVEGQVPGHAVVQVAYVGSLGRHLPIRTELNQLPPLPLTANPYGPGQAISAADRSSISGTAATGYRAR